MLMTHSFSAPTLFIIKWSSRKTIQLCVSHKIKHKFYSGTVCICTTNIEFVVCSYGDYPICKVIILCEVMDLVMQRWKILSRQWQVACNQ